jgi:hypothetical protein
MQWQQLAYADFVTVASSASLLLCKYSRSAHLLYTAREAPDGSCICLHDSSNAGKNISGQRALLWPLLLLIHAGAKKLTMGTAKPFAAAV